MLATPLLLGGILLARDRRLAPWLGVTVAGLATVKLSYALPAVALVAVSADWRRTARWALAAAAVEIALTLIVFDAAGVWRDTILAQLQRPHVGLRSLTGEWAQVAWHLAGLLVGAGLAWRYRRYARDRRTLVVAVTVAVATLGTLLSIWKLGTSLNSVVPAEVTLVPLAVAGSVWALRAGRRNIAAIGAVGLAFAVSQGVALIAAPHVHGAHPFLRPGSSPSYGITLSADEVNAAVGVARRCPAGVPYSGTPIIAFIAGRRMPAQQPDQYLAQLAPALHEARDAIASVKVRCPLEPPATH
jgi:hypothetical protein